MSLTAAVEGNRTFELKQTTSNKDLLNERIQKASKEAPLQELEKEQSKVNTFAFYFNKITNGTIQSSKELIARAAQRINQRTGVLYEDKEQTNAFIRGGFFLSLDGNERVKLEDTEQLQALNLLITEKNAANNELKNNQKTANELNFYASNVSQRNFSDPKVLKSRMEQRINQRTGVLFEDKEQTDAFIRGGSYLSLGANERVKLEDTEQQDVFLEIATTLNDSTIENNKNNSDLQELSFYINRISKSSDASEQEFIARVEQRINQRTGVLFEDKEQTKQFIRGGFFLSLGVNERVKVNNQENLTLLIDIYKLVNDPQIPAEARTLAKNFLASGSQEDLDRVKTIFVANGNEQQSEKLIGTIEKYNITRKTLEFKQQFYNQLLDKKSLDGATDILAKYGGSRPEDIVLVIRLRSKISTLRRAEVIATFTKELSNGNFTKAFEILENLGKSQIQRDRECAIIFAKALYKLELATYRDQIVNKIQLNTDPQNIYKAVEELPIRPPLENLDYVQLQVKLKDTVSSIYTVVEKIKRLNTINNIRSSFKSGDVDDILKRITSLPNETEEEIAAKLQVFNLYRNYIAANKPDVFDTKFKGDIINVLNEQLQQAFINPELGKNKKAFNYVRENFLNVIFPIVESFKDDPRTKKTVLEILNLDKKIRNISPRLQYLQKISELEKQRPLTDVERAYLESVELLTLFNPYLVSILSANSGVVSEFIKHHFNVLSEKTREELQDGAYVPLIHIGAGPDGLAAFGELVRNKPEVAEQSIVIDQGEQPGGPFAIPNGPAWELNSANKRGLPGYFMPDTPKEELKTVRAYGSPVARWFPGERQIEENNGRKGRLSVRLGSINTTVDYLPTPDDISVARYPTNEELQILLALQSAVLMKKVAFRTEFIGVRPNPNSNEKGDKIVTLKINNSDGSSRIVNIKTDAVIGSTGLGEPTYGFKLEGTRAEKVIAQTQSSSGFPKITTTLPAFNALADRTQESVSPGNTLVIYGKGNSADTLIEFVGSLFQGANPRVRDVTKIYLICEGGLSARPRYALISDLKPRNGRGNLIEQINSKVTDIDFATNTGNTEDRQLLVFDANNKPILDSEGNVINADSVIAATGFRPKIDQILEPYLNGKRSNSEGADAPLQPLTLPTNPDVAVAEFFKEDPNILLVGTASNPRFTSAAKLAQLPFDAANALLRNGAENAVAIGFRAPDTQAAVNIWLSSRNINLEAEPEKPKRTVTLEGNIDPNTSLAVKINVDRNNLGIPNNVQQEDLLLSPILAYNLGNDFRLDSNFNGSVEFNLEYDPLKEEFKIRFKGGDVQNISSQFIRAVEKGIVDKDFQRYAYSLLEKRRGEPKLGITINFKSGEINPQKTFIQTI